jgi:DNA repair protein RAD50
MTSVDKLLIKGIRSFNPDNRNIIEFYKPLTIIVGQNGAGKTVSSYQLHKQKHY